MIPSKSWLNNWNFEYLIIFVAYLIVYSYSKNEKGCSAFSKGDVCVICPRFFIILRGSIWYRKKIIHTNSELSVCGIFWKTYFLELIFIFTVNFKLMNGDFYLIFKRQSHMKLIWTEFFKPIFNRRKKIKINFFRLLQICH